MKHYVHSTASQDMTYPIYSEGQQNQARIIKSIIIKGRANVTDPRTLFTPTGAVTEVSEEDLALLKKSDAFQRHVLKGFMKVMDDVSELDVNDLNARDNSAQLRDEEYAKGLDPRVPGSDRCQASCGEKDAVVGVPGNHYKGEIL